MSSAPRPRAARCGAGGVGLTREHARVFAGESGFADALHGL